MSNRFLIIHTISIIILLFTFGCRVIRKDTVLDSEIRIKNTDSYIEALHLLLLGRDNDALTMLIRIADSDKEHSASRYEIARIYFRKRDYDTAQEYIRQAIKISPHNKWYNLLLIDIYEKTGNYKSIIPVYRGLIKANTNDMALYIGLSNTYVHLNNLDDAIAVLDELEKNTGVSNHISLRKHQIYLLFGKITSALKELKKLSDNFPSEITYHITIAEHYFQMGNYNEALKYYGKALEQDSSNYETILAMAECYMRTGNNSKAMKLFDILFDLPDVNIDIKIQVILHYYDLSAFDTSLNNHVYQLLEKLTKSHFDDPKSHSLYGDFLYNDKRYAEAAEKWRKVISIDPSNYKAWIHIFMCYDIIKQYDTLASLAIKSIEYFPEQARGYFFAGYAFYMLKQYSLTVEYMSQAIEYAVTDNNIKIQSLIYIAEAYNSMKKHALSDEMFEAVLALDPENTFALNNYSFYLALRGENLEKALKMSDKTLKINPQSPSYLDTYGWILYKMERYDEAENYIRKAVKLSTEPNPVILQNYGDVLYKLGQYEKSVKYWKLAIESGGDEKELKERISRIEK